jgi:hypothetical protein
MVLATTATMAITGITHHTPEDSEMLALTRHTTRYRPVIPIKVTTITAKPASIQHATLPLWETGGGGKIVSLCTCAGLNLTLCAGQKGEDWCGIGGMGARHKPIVRRASGLSATVSQIRLYHRRSS